MPIERDDFFFMLGLAMRAGQLTLGESGVSKAISAGAARLVLLDEDASENTKKKFRDSCAYHGVPLSFTQAQRLGQAVGRPGRMCAAAGSGSLGERLCVMAAQQEESGIRGTCACHLEG